MRPRGYGVDIWFWRPVLGEMATYTEVTRDWSFRTLFQAHTLLDARDDMTEYDRGIQEAEAMKLRRSR